jgi:hypothetical protein
MRLSLLFIFFSLAAYANDPNPLPTKLTRPINCVGATDALLGQSGLTELGRETWVGPQPAYDLQTRRLDALDTHAAQFKAAFKGRALKPAEREIAQALVRVHQEHAASLGYDIAERFSNVDDLIVILSPSEFKRASQLYSTEDETLAFAINLDLIVLPDGLSEIAFVHLLNHELTHVSSFRAAERVPSPPNWKVYTHSGFSRYNQMDFHLFNEGFTELLNQHLMMTAASSQPALSQSRDCIMSDSCPTAYELYKLLVLELFNNLSEKSGKSLLEIAKIFTRSYLNGDSAAINLIEAHFGNRGVEILRDLRHNTESTQEAWKFFEIRKDE